MIVAAIVIVLLFVLYLYGTKNFNYWKKRGIKHDTPVLLFGTNAKNYLLQQNLSQVAADVYRRYPNEKVVGFFRSTRPELVIRDPNIVKRILVTDFPYFYRRGLFNYKNVSEPLLRNLIFEDSDLWRLLRQYMSPAFTISKLRLMFPLVAERAEQLRSQTLVVQGQPLDANELMARYTTDVIGAVGFGLDTGALNDEDSAFRILGRSIFKLELKHIIIMVLKDMFPKLFRHAKFFPGIEKPIRDLVSGILEHRNHKPSGRNDFIDLMLECQARGKMVGKSLENTKCRGVTEVVSMELTDELIAAQVLVFFAAGFETSSLSNSCTLHQLAYHSEVQERVQAEIDRVLSRHNNKITYEAINEMNYLECVYKETLRMFPPVGILIRKCAESYTIPELGVTIDEGVGVIIPVVALHYDPQHFDEPHQFRPERFLRDNAEQINKHLYLPFGDGPRACIATRLGLMQSLAGLAAVLSRFSVSPAETTLRHPVLELTSNIVQRYKGGLPLIFQDRFSTNSKEIQE